MDDDFDRLCLLEWCFLSLFSTSVDRVGELLMGYQDVTFLLPELAFSPQFVNIVVKALGASLVLKVWLGLSKGMVPVKYLYPLKVWLGGQLEHGSCKILLTPRSVVVG